MPGTDVVKKTDPSWLAVWSSRVVCCLFSIGLLLCTTACGNGKKPTYTVRGQLLDAAKKPAAGAIVTLQPETPDPKDAARPIGVVDDQGNYTLTTYTTGDGAPEGSYVITIIWPPLRRTPFDPAGGDQLKGKLDRPEKSSYRYTVERKPDQEIPVIILP